MLLVRMNFLFDVLTYLQHTLLESEAENVRTSILTALQRIKCFGEEVNESMRRFGTVIQQIEGGYQVMQTDDNNSTVTDQVKRFLH